MCRACELLGRARFIEIGGQHYRLRASFGSNQLSHLLKQVCAASGDCYAYAFLSEPHRDDAPNADAARTRQECGLA